MLKRDVTRKEKAGIVGVGGILAGTPGWRQGLSWTWSMHDGAFSCMPARAAQTPSRDFQLWFKSFSIL